MDAGRARLKRGDASGAGELLSKAHALMHVPTTGLMLARADLAAGRLVEAREVALEVARMPKDAGQPTVFRTSIDAAQELAAEVKTRIPTLKLSFTNGPPKTVAIDDGAIAAELLDVPLAVNPGHHVVVAVDGVGGAHRAEVRVAEGESKPMTIELPVGSNVSAMGAQGAPTAAAGPAAPEATGATSDHSATPRILMYGGFGVGGAGLAVGAITGLFTLSLASKVTPSCQNNLCAPSAAGDLHSANTFATVSDAAFVIGALGLSTGIVGIVLRARGKTETPVSVAVTPRGAALLGEF
jgi:hypothetical protein